MIPHSQIAELARKGMRPGDISRKLEIAVDKVYYSIKRSRKAGVKIPLFGAAQRLDPAKERMKAERSTRHVAVPGRVFSLLEREAARQGKTPTETAQRLLEDALLGTVRS